MKKFRFLGALLVIAALVAASRESSGGSSWPQFRGPGRDGVSAERGLLARFPEGGPAVLWRRPAGAGYSGVAAVGGRVYTMWQTGEGQFLLGLDADTGEELWRYRMSDAYASPYGDGPRSTPVVQGETIFVIDALAGLHAVRSRDGSRLWAHDLTALGAEVPSSGYASTPIVVDHRLLVEAGGAEGAYLAFDGKSGEQLWSAGADVAGYSSPIAVSIGGVRQVVFFSGSGLRAVSPADGRTLWHHPWESRCPATGVPLNSASPIFVPPDKLVVAKAYGEDRGAMMLRIIREEGAYATETVWQSPVLDSRINSPVLLDGRLYGFHGGMLQAVDVENGRELWKQRGFQRGSLIAADGKLIVLGERGKLAMFEASPSPPRELGSAQVLDGQSWTSPSLAGRRLYLRNQEQLACLDLRRREIEAVRPGGGAPGEGGIR